MILINLTHFLSIFYDIFLLLIEKNGICKNKNHQPNNHSITLNKATYTFILIF